MMIVRLMCPVCTLKAAKIMKDSGLPQTNVEVLTPIAQVADDGKYEARCELGHVSKVFLDNIKFELLFEMGVNGLIDGYRREAVTSFASALERFYEFYWHVTIEHSGIPNEIASTTWKIASKQSERQLGMFITASLILTKQKPDLLNSNEVKFRNDVIHDGYIPSDAEAISFGNRAMQLINCHLDDLRKIAPNALTETYKRFSPAPETEPGKHDGQWNEDEEHQGVVNHLCTIDVRHPNNDNLKIKGVEGYFERILQERLPHTLELCTEAELLKRFPKRDPQEPSKHTPHELKSNISDIAEVSETHTPTAIVFSGQHSAFLFAPEGHLIDREPKGPYLASIYPSGELPEKTSRPDSFIYVVISSKDKNLPDLEALLELQEKAAKTNYAAPHIEYKTTIERQDCKTKLRIITASEFAGTVDCTLFMDFQEVVIFITLLSAQDKFDENLNRLEWVGRNLIKGKVLHQSDGKLRFTFEKDAK